MAGNGAAREPSPRVSIVDFIRHGVLDLGVAALGWLLAEAGVPVLVAGAREAATHRQLLREAMTDLAAPDLRHLRIDPRGGGLAGLTAADAATTLLVGLDLTSDPAPALQVPFRALARGADMVASIEANRLEEVFARLRRFDIRLTEDELTFVGLVLVLRRVAVDSRSVSRVVAAHYVRPLARDPGGHLQRLGPAVLATWDSTTDAFEDFAWGVATELASRVGLRPGDLDREIGRRRDFLSGLLAGGVREPESVRAAVRGYRLSDKSAGGAGGV